MKKILSILLLFGIAIGFGVVTTSCKNHQPLIVQLPPDTVRVTTTIREIVHDTVFKIPADSSKFTAKITVDSIGNVSLTNVKIKTGSYVKTPSVKIHDNILTIDCEAKAQELFHQWKEQYIKESISTKTAYVPPIQITNNNKHGLNWWQTTLMWCGGIFIFLTILSAFGYLLKFYIKK